MGGSTVLLLVLVSAVATAATQSDEGGLPPWAQKPSFRQLLTEETMEDGGGSWPPAADAVLEQRGGGSWPPAADVVVAQGGGGDFVTITDAIKNAPKGHRRYVIRVKEGIYDETLNITRRNVVLLGDGIQKTVITGNKSVAITKIPTDQTATVNALGHGFVAQDLTIENTAGPQGNQAIALRSNSNKSIIYRCRLKGYQDTLYAENNLQLYLGCDLYGTVDFVFGNAKAVFQDCRLMVRRPKIGAHNIVTAQGRNSDSHDSGFVFQNCTVQATDEAGKNLTGVDTYLGRPWRNHSRVVFMDCFLGDVVSAQGWVAWNKSQEVEATKSTVSYMEFRNRGPKADTTHRIMWPGFWNLTDAKDAQNYTVDRFINGNLWVPRLIHYNNNI